MKQLTGEKMKNGNSSFFRLIENAEAETLAIGQSRQNGCAEAFIRE